MFTFHQLSEKRGYAATLNKAAMLNEVGRIALAAYELGATLDEVRAICGAAYGDWDEAQNLNVSQELPLQKESVRGH